MQQRQQPSPIAQLPATFANTPGCEGCLALTITLRPDGAPAGREVLVVQRPASLLTGQGCPG